MVQRILPQFSLEGRTAIVSGAASGLGLAIAEALAEAGANVAILYHSNIAAIQAAKKVEEEYNVKCSAYRVDVTQADDVESTINQVVDDFNGRLDCFIANSGISWNETSVLDSSINHYREIMATNLDSVYYCARAAGLHWRRQAKDQTTTHGKELIGFRKGSFVATASMSGHIVNFPHIQTAYNASKAGVIHMCKIRHLFNAAGSDDSDIQLTSASGGFIESGLTGAVSDEIKDVLRAKTPLPRIGELHEMKGAYLYLASDASSFATGTDIVADGGYCLW